MATTRATTPLCCRLRMPRGGYAYVKNSASTTSALDPEITAGILKVLRTLAEEKMTMVIVTHEIAFARNVSDKVVFMDSGYIIEEGKPEDVIDNPSNDRTRAFLQKF